MFVRNATFCCNLHVILQLQKPCLSKFGILLSMKDIKKSYYVTYIYSSWQKLFTFVLQFLLVCPVQAVPAIDKKKYTA
jgi:hypothetical protein